MTQDSSKSSLSYRDAGVDIDAAKVAMKLGKTTNKAAARLYGTWRKLGFGSPSALQRLGLPGPLIGFLTSRVLLDPNQKISIAGWTRPSAVL